MRADKLEKYAQHFGDLERRGARYEPAVLGCRGSGHPRATQMISHAGARAARRMGHANSRPLLSRWRQRVAAEVWLRAARMIKACYPARQKHEEGWDEEEDAQQQQQEIWLGR